MTKSEKHNNQISPFPTSITEGGTVLVLVPNEIYFETFGMLPEEEMDDLIRHHKLQLVREIPGLFSVEFNTVF